MKKSKRNLVVLATFMAALVITPLAHAEWGKNVSNPCGKKEALKNPCNPCAEKAKNVCNPCNPCSKKKAKDYSKLVSTGEKLWSDNELGKSGLSCMSCHAGHESLNLDKVGPFPHYVGMPDRMVTLDQMINYCMMNPMETDPLPWDSIKMTAMAVYYQEYIKSYSGTKNVCNPCSKKMKNPCNPCNPCRK